MNHKKYLCCIEVAVLLLVMSVLTSCSPSSDIPDRGVYSLARFNAKMAIVRYDDEDYVFSQADCTNFKLWISSCTTSDIVLEDGDYVWDYQIVFSDIAKDECLENEYIFYIPYTAYNHYVNIDSNKNVIQFDNKLYFIDPTFSDEFYDGINIYLNAK